MLYIYYFCFIIYNIIENAEETNGFKSCFFIKYYILFKQIKDYNKLYGVIFVKGI